MWGEGVCEARGRQGDGKCGGGCMMRYRGYRIKNLLGRGIKVESVKVEGGKEIASKCGGRVCVKLEGGGGVRDVGRLAFCDVVVK